MAAFSLLTPAEQGTILAYLGVMRSSVISFTKALNTIQDMDSVWNSTVKAIHAKVDGTEIIPDVNGLSGSQPLTAADILVMMNAFEAILALNNTPAYRNYYVRAAGPGNTMQSG